MNQRLAFVEFVVNERRVRAGFRVTQARELAGGPIELEFFVELTGPGSFYLLIPADRMRQRPGAFYFSASFAGVLLGDPYEDFPDMGGPAGVIEISAAQPWHQPLILNQFVRLERAVDLMLPGASDTLVVTCRRALSLAAGREPALQPGGQTEPVEVPLVLRLRRQDDELAELIARLIWQVSHGPQAERERPLALLLSLRTALAIERSRTLLHHPDPLVVERVRHALQFTDRAG